MTMSNQELLAKLDSAFKFITVGDLNQGVLQPGKFDAFIRAMQQRTMILNEARFIKMDSQQEDIDRVGFVGRVLRSGTDDAGAHRELPQNQFVSPAFNTNNLVAVELQAITGIRDRALRRNIERAGFENTLIDLFGEAAGRDLEEFGLLADENIAWADDDVLSLTDGWIELADNKVYGLAGGVGRDFDPADPEEMFDAMIQALPKQFLQNRAEWRFYVDFEVEDSYRNILKARGTALGDTAQTTANPLVYKGIPVKYCPMIERSDDATGAGRVATLQHPDNMAWGVFHEVTIEKDRIPKDRRTDFVLTFEGDVGYEDENAAVSAYLNRARP